MGWLWIHCNRKSCLLIHTHGPINWASGGDCSRRWTPDGHLSQHSNFWFSSFFKFDKTHSSRWSRHCISVYWIHLFSPKAWCCASDHTHPCMPNDSSEHMPRPTPPPPPQPKAVGPESQPFSLQHNLTCKSFKNVDKSRWWVKADAGPSLELGARYAGWGNQKNRWCQIGAPRLQQELPELCFTGLSRPLLVSAPFEYRNSASVWCVVPSLTSSWASGHETGGRTVSAPPTHIYFYMNFTIHFSSIVFLLFFCSLKDQRPLLNVK